MDYSMMRFPNFKYKALTLSYDDGVIYDEKLIKIMSNYGLKGTFNLNSGLFSSNDGFRLNKEQALQLYLHSGNEVAVHGYEHLSLPALEDAVAINEVLKDRISLEQTFGKIIKGMAYAFGTFDDRIVDILKKSGILYSRTVVSTERFDIPKDWLRLPATCHHANPRLMELAKEFVDLTPSQYYWINEPKLFYLWGHSYEFNDNDNWDIFEQFAKFIGNREDIWYATNMEIYEYIKAFENLKYSADGNLVENCSLIDIYLNYYGKEILIKTGDIVTLK